LPQPGCCRRHRTGVIGDAIRAIRDKRRRVRSAWCHLGG
jgi:hypothetical protein